MEIAEGLTSDLKEGLRAGGVSVSDEEVAKVSLACVSVYKICEREGESEGTFL